MTTTMPDRELPRTEPLDPAAIVEESVRLLLDRYVFPDVAAELAVLLRERLAAGAYRTQEPAELAERVTADLQSVNGDRHLRLVHHETPVPEGEGAATLALMRRRFDASLGGVHRLELLEGGVAVLELGPAFFPVDWAAETFGPALALASRAEALVLDLRGNRGGDPDTVAFVCSYLLDERTHLNTMHWREGGRTLTAESWSLPYVPGPRFGGSKPLYVLTGPGTFSAAEECAYDLQQLGRAVIVGEPSGGGAHPREGYTVHPNLEVSVSTGRAVNPVSGTNWEGTGVQPDVPVPAAEALDRAVELARERLTALSSS
jgi:hypothetical protein